MTSATATIRRDTGTTDINVRKTPGRSQTNVQSKLPIGTANLPIVEVTEDEKGEKANDKVYEWFEMNPESKSPYMQLVANVNQQHRINVTAEQQALAGIEKLKLVRSTIPAVTHVDYSARIQTVHQETNPRFYALLDEFEKLTGCPILINTSFNVRGEPIVCSPEDAYRCFRRTDMDYLVMGNIILKKADQPSWINDDSWQQTFELD